MRIYSPVSYQLGDATDATVTPAQAQKKLNQMKSSLARWLSLRNKVTLTAGSTKYQAQRLAGEQILADKIVELLGEAGFSASQIPASNVSQDPDAAVKLAQVVLTGAVPVPTATGGLGVWMIVLPIAAVAYIVSTYIQSQADLQAQQEQINCVESGACTDSGFWLKAGAIAFIGWLLWDKLGGKEGAHRIQKSVAA